MPFRGILLVLAVSVATLGLVACGSDTPASPSGSGSVTLEGVLLGEGAAFTASDDDGASSSDGPVVVEIVGTDLSVTISGNGTFKIEEIPEGGITVRFTQDGVVLAEFGVPYAAEGTTVKIVVKKEGQVIVLVDLEMDTDDDDGDSDDDGDDPDDATSASCVVDGGRQDDRIELEGNVVSGHGTDFNLATNRSSVAVHVLAEEAEFKCNGNTAGGDPCPDAVQEGAKVHVRGTLTTCTSSEATVTATQVKVQKAAS
jgi:hypothetical protein